jgi:hypothetical protein
LSAIIVKGLQFQEVGDLQHKTFTKHTLQIYNKLSYEALSRQFLVGDVMGWFYSVYKNFTTFFVLKFNFYGNRYSEHSMF